MKKKPIRFDAEALVRSIEGVRDGVTGRRKLAFRTATVKLPPPAPPIAAAEIARLAPGSASASRCSRPSSTSPP